MFAGVLGRKDDLLGGGGGGGGRVPRVAMAGVSSGVRSVLLGDSGGVDVNVGGLGCCLTALRFGRGGGTLCLMGE